MKSWLLLLIALVVFALAYAVAGAALGTPPAATDSGRAVAAWFQAHDDNVRLWAWCYAVAAVAFAVFAVFVRDRLPEPHRDLFFFGAVAFVVETTIQAWVWAGLALHADSLAPATARTLLDVASFWGPLLTSATVLTLAPIAVLGLRAEVLPRWLGVIAGVALAEQAVETITIFGNHGFTAPGGPMNLMLGAGLCGVTWLSLGGWLVVTLRRES